MKYIYLATGVIAILLLTALTIGHLDATYQTVRHSVDSITESESAWSLASPNKKQFHILLKNHWKVSPLFSNLEDVFYPFRQWKDHIGHALKYSGRYDELNSQLTGLVKVEKQTKVRALRAHFLAERRNFRDPALNNDFLNKDAQWRAILTNIIQRKVDLINGSYNNQWLGMMVLGTVFLVMFFLTNIRDAIVVMLGVALALLMGSFYRVVEFGVPFHWFLIAWLILLGNSRGMSSPSLIKYISFSIPLLVATSSTIGLVVGVIAMQLIWCYPRCKRALYFLFWIHPFGAWYVLQKERKVRPLLLIWGLAFSIIMGLKLVGGYLLLTAPIAYLGQLGIILNAVILMMVSACLLDDNKEASHRSKLIIMGVAMGCIVLIKELLGTPLFGWGFSFLWNPIIQWGSIFGICICLIKHRRLKSSDDPVV